MPVPGLQRPERSPPGLARTTFFPLALVLSVELDGVRVRARWHELPIIAMTANAMAGDRERAEAAVMDNPIAEPLDVRTMLGTIGVGLPRREAAEPT